MLLADPRSPANSSSANRPPTELHTGIGAHFHYVEHLSAVLKEFFKQVPKAKQWAVEGTAEPE